MTNANTIYQSMIAISNRHLCDCTKAPADDYSTTKYVQQLNRIINHTPKAIILREKDLSIEDYETLARKVVETLDTGKSPVIVHKYVKVAQKLKIPCLHLSFSDLQMLYNSGQKSYLSQLQMLGCSIHSKEEALQAASYGATYLLAGNVFETDCKKGLPGRGLTFLEDVSGAVSIPVYALGGITLENASMCMDHGAAGFAMMSGAMKL